MDILRQNKSVGLEAERRHEIGTARRMGRPTLSNEELLDRALDLFLENGFERTSIEAITSAAGVAKRTVYARYGDKETLFRAAMQRAIDEWIVPVERLRDAETDDLEETLLRIAEILVANIMSPAGLRLMRLTNAVACRMPEVAAHNVQQGTEPTVSYLAELFGRRIGPTGMGQLNPEEAAMAFIHLVVGGPPNMAAWGVQLDQASIDRHTNYSVQIFLHGVLQSAAGCKEREENQRLRRMLTNALLENDSLKEKLGQPSIEGRSISAV